MKHKPKTLLIIAAVAVMLAGPASAYGYFEIWNGWFNSGELRLTINYHEYTFDYVSGEGALEDETSGDKDYFSINTVPALTFTCTGVGTIQLWVTSCSGSKDTGQSGTKEVDEGATWSGHAIFTSTGFPSKEFEEVVGTWDTDDESDCFNYQGTPPIYSAEWDVTDSDPDGLDGDGGSQGYRIYPQP